MSEKDGGAAFPFHHVDPYNRVGPTASEGMSLRDYAAIKALCGILASYSGQDVALPPAKWAAATAYEYADAMLAEREK